MSPRFNPTLAMRFWVLASCLLAASALPAQDDATPPRIAPKLFGFDIPAGPLKPGGAAVATRDEDGRVVTAKVHVAVGENFIVMLPDGTLVARRAAEVQATDNPFAAEAKDALAKRLTTGKLEGFRTSQTRRYLYVYNTTETFAVVTSRILETMFPGVTAYAKAQKIDVREPEVPLVVVMYKDRAEYQRATNAPDGMIAFYNAVDNRVSMYENSRLAYDRPDLAVQQAVATIAHEGPIKSCTTSAYNSD